MKFTIKTAMIGIGLTSLLVAALFSKSPLFLGLLTSVVLMLIPLVLVFAICDVRKSRRPFWIGSFIMSLTCVCGSYAFDMFSSIEYEIAQYVCLVGSPNLAQYDANNSSPLSVPAFDPVSNAFQPTLLPPVSSGFQPVAPTYPTPTPYAVPVGYVNNPVYVNSSYNENYQAVVEFVPIFFSVLAGVCGGLAALWISKTPKDSAGTQGEITDPV